MIYRLQWCIVQTCVCTTPIFAARHCHLKNWTTIAHVNWPLALHWLLQIVAVLSPATESMVCSGGNKRGQFDTDLPDDASPSGATYDSCRQTPTRGRPFKLQITSPRKSKFAFPYFIAIFVRIIQIPVSVHHCWSFSSQQSYFWRKNVEHVLLGQRTPTMLCNLSSDLQNFIEKCYFSYFYIHSGYLSQPPLCLS